MQEPKPHIVTIADGIYLVESSAAAELGAARQSAHAENGTERFYDDRNAEDARGVAGELALAAMLDCAADLGVYRDGDGGFDFEFQVGKRKLTLDVKAARKPVYRLVKAADANRCADILVLAGLD